MKVASYGHVKATKQSITRTSLERNHSRLTPIALTIINNCLLYLAFHNFRALQNINSCGWCSKYYPHLTNGDTEIGKLRDLTKTTEGVSAREKAKNSAAPNSYLGLHCSVFNPH